MPVYDGQTMQIDTQEFGACALVQDLLPLYIEGEVSTGSQEVISQHLQRCERCTGFLAGAQSMRTQLRRERTIPHIPPIAPRPSILAGLFYPLSWLLGGGPPARPAAQPLAHPPRRWFGRNTVVRAIGMVMVILGFATFIGGMGQSSYLPPCDDVNYTYECTGQSPYPHEDFEPPYGESLEPPPPSSGENPEEGDPNPSPRAPQGR